EPLVLKRKKKRLQPQDFGQKNRALLVDGLGCRNSLPHVGDGLIIKRERLLQKIKVKKICSKFKLECAKQIVKCIFGNLRVDLCQPDLLVPFSRQKNQLLQLNFRVSGFGDIEKPLREFIVNILFDRDIRVAPKLCLIDRRLRGIDVEPRRQKLQIVFQKSAFGLLKSDDNGIGPCSSSLR